MTPPVLSQPFVDRRYHERRLPRFGALARVRRLAEKVFWPYPTLNLSARRCYERVRAREGEQASERRYLMVGSGIDPGQGSAALGPVILGRTVSTDIERFERVAVRSDARALPFRTASFDGVFCQNVLNLVLDPMLALEEMDRVLRPGGVLYLETPFLQPHHDAPTDSTRLTFTGLCRALPGYTVLDGGPSMGPSSTAAWLTREYLRLWLSPGKRYDDAVRFFLNYGVLPLKFLDHALNRRAGAHGLACAIHLLGEKPVA